MSFSPQLFLSNINAKEGLAKPSRYEVILPIPEYINSFFKQSFFEQLLNLPNNLIGDISNIVKTFNPETQDVQSQTYSSDISRYLSLQCEATSIPGKSLITADAKIYGPQFRVPYQTQYDDFSMTILCTNEFYERKLFDKWIESIMPTDTNNLRFPRGQDSRYMTNIKVIQYDEFIRQIYAVELIDAFPIGITAQPLSWMEDNFHRLTINFAYLRHRTIYQGQYDIVRAASALFGVKFSQFINEKVTDLTAPLGSVYNDLIDKL